MGFHTCRQTKQNLKDEDEPGGGLLVAKLQGRNGGAKAGEAWRLRLGDQFVYHCPFWSVKAGVSGPWQGGMAACGLATSE